MPVPASFKRQKQLQDALALANDIYVGANKNFPHLLFVFGEGIILETKEDQSLAHEIVQAITLLAEQIKSSA